LSKGDVRFLKLFRQTVPWHWPGGGKTAVTKLMITAVCFNCIYNIET